ncbi:MAG: hypothetical protein IJR14_00055 [Synergistaceae bacterium]|nr:hypothetical protein [Synergistaceae bacterium]
MTLADKVYQMTIPSGLSPRRYISGYYALNLPAPEDTSGDWHFSSVFYRYEEDPGPVTLAGEGERIDTNAIWGDWGIYCCDDSLRRRALKAPSPSYAANHFRAILDLLYESVRDGKEPAYLCWASVDYLDTEEEKALLLAKAAEMIPHLDDDGRALLEQWIREERDRER